MKKQFLFLLLLGLLCSVRNSWGDTTVSATQFTASQSGTTYTVSAKSGYGDLSGVTVKTVGANGGVGSNRLKVPAGTLVVEASDGNVIKSVNITWRNSSNQYPTSDSELTSSPSGVSTSSQTSLWEGSAASVTFTNKTSNTFQVVGLSITYGASSGGGGGDEPTSYTVTASSNNVSYGTASAGDSSLETGETTTITATPKSGYRFVSWAVSGTGSTLSSTTTNPTTLTMGSANTTVTATFEAIPTSLTPQSSKTWNFSEATWSSVSVATNSSTIVDDMELIATTQAIAMSSGSAISFPDGSSYSKYSSFKSNKTNQLHIKVAPYSKVTVYVKGGSGRTISVLEGSISGTSLMAEATSSSQSNPSCHYLGDVDGDLYITNSGGSNNLYIYAVKVEPLVHGTIGATGWTTFASSSKLDLSTISGGTAYFAASISENDVTLTSTSKIVEAGEGLMIKGTPDAVFAIETTTVAATFSDNNLLTGCITEANVGVNPDKYVLVNVGGEPKFQSLAEHGATIPAGKAYLDLTGGSPAPGLLRIVEGENNATAIEEFKANEDVVKFIENGRILILRDGITYDALGRIVK